MRQFYVLLNLIFLFSSVIKGQEIFSDSIQIIDLSRISNFTNIPQSGITYDTLIYNIMNQTSLDSLIAHVRILSGEDSVWINGSKVRIQNRNSSRGKDLAADYLKKQLETYGLEVRDESFYAIGRNIYAIQPGYIYPDKQYIICAHYDAVTDYCANDNASSVATVLEAARILSHYCFKYSLVYALWDREESSPFGADYYAQNARYNLSDILGVLNMEMIGWDSDQDGLFAIASEDVSNSNVLANLVVITNSLYELPLSPVIYNPGGEGSDQASFWAVGYGAITLFNSGYPYYHTVNDRIDKFNLAYFHNLSKLSVGAISTLVEINMDTLIGAMNPNKGCLTYTSEINIKGRHTSFMDSKETLVVWLSKGVETIMADSVVVQSNASLTAYIYIPEEASVGLWDVNVETDTDHVLSQENSFEIFPRVPDAAGTITGEESVCRGNISKIYTVPEIRGASSYIWTLPNGVIKPSKENEISVIFGKDAVSGNIRVKGHNFCADGSESTLYITLNVPPTPIITIEDSILHSNASEGNQWYMGSNMIPGATDSIYIPEQDGWYYVIVTLGGCPSKASNAIQYPPTTGIELTNSTEQIIMYPNPSAGQITVSFSTDPIRQATIKVFNLQGNLVYSEIIQNTIKAEIDLTALPKGMYLIRVITNENNYNGKVCLE